MWITTINQNWNSLGTVSAVLSKILVLSVVPHVLKHQEDIDCKTEYVLCSYLVTWPFVRQRSYNLGFASVTSFLTDWVAFLGCAKDAIKSMCMLQYFCSRLSLQRGVLFSPYHTLAYTKTPLSSPEIAILAFPKMTTSGQHCICI